MMPGQPQQQRRRCQRSRCCTARSRRAGVDEVDRGVLGLAGQEQDPWTGDGRGHNQARWPRRPRSRPHGGGGAPDDSDRRPRQRTRLAKDKLRPVDQVQAVDSACRRRRGGAARGRPTQSTASPGPGAGQDRRGARRSPPRPRPASRSPSRSRRINSIPISAQFLVLGGDVAVRDQVVAAQRSAGPGVEAPLRSRSTSDALGRSAFDRLQRRRAVDFLHKYMGPPDQCKKCRVPVKVHRHARRAFAPST